MPSPTTHAAPTGTESHDAFKDTTERGFWLSGDATCANHFYF